MSEENERKSVVFPSFFYLCNYDREEETIR